MDISEQLFERAKRVLPGGVNSPVRAYRAVGMAPRFITRADGAYIYDEDGKRYIAYVCSWGPMILGHNHPVIREAVERAVKDGLSFGAPTRREVDIAERMISMVPNIEMVRMVNSGTEAVMSALRLARGATGRDKLIKFEGCYHGHSDCMLVNAGSSALAGGHPSSAGVPVGAARDTLTAQFNDLASVEALLEQNPGQVAAVIVEPVAANMGVVGPAPGFLEGLRALCDKHGALLIFDEVITGFRLAPGGAQEYFGVRADLVTFGKIIGGGMPVGAYCGSRALLEQVAPCGPVYQAGTLSGNPVAMAAGLAQLTYLREHPEVYEHINARGAALAEGLRELVKRTGAPVVINQLGSLLAPFFTPTAVTTFTDAKGSDVAKYARYFQGMLERGVALAPAQFEAMFVSEAHTQAELAATLAAAEAVFQTLLAKTKAAPGTFWVPGAVLRSAFDFVHPPLVAAALKRGVEEGLHNAVGHIVPNQSAAHGQHVGVVVPPGHLGGEGLAAQGAADALHLVGGDGDADARGADNDTPVARAGGHRLRSRPAEVGVVAALCGVAAEVLILQAAGVQVLHDVALEGEPSVVGTQCDHIYFLLIRVCEIRAGAFHRCRRGGSRTPAAARRPPGLPCPRPPGCGRRSQR